jgi:hypothetical protein
MFLALLTSLPTGNSTLRMRVWRALKSSGCAVLRDGVYLLPTGTPRSVALAEAESEVKAAGGFAMTVELNLKTSAQLEHVRKLFDRKGGHSTARKAKDRYARAAPATIVRRTV